MNDSRTVVPVKIMLRSVRAYTRSAENTRCQHSNTVSVRCVEQAADKQRTSWNHKLNHAQNNKESFENYAVAPVSTSDFFLLPA